MLNISHEEQIIFHESQDTGTSRAQTKEMYRASLVVIVTLFASVAGRESAVNYCPYFKNRAPSPQLNLNNCTWYKDSACCLRQELDIIFNGVPPLVGANKECLTQTNYLMCFVCAPDQNTFYKNERLTVCDEFCNNWYSACKKATLKGIAIKKLYGTGAEFCKARKFVVKDRSSSECFFYKAPVHSSASVPSSGLFMFAAIVVVLVRQF